MRRETIARNCYEDDPAGIMFIHNGAPQALVGSQAGLPRQEPHPELVEG
jgi:hypothetical protein